MTPADQDRVRVALTEHWLAGLDCDEATHQDRPRCACSRVNLGWHPSVGAAVAAHVPHIVAVLAAQDEVGGTGQ